MDQTDRRSAQGADVKGLFAEAWAQLRRLADRDPDSRQEEELLEQAVEMVVDGTDPRMRIVMGYHRRLRQSVASLYRYVDEHVNELPPAMQVSGALFGNDARINSFFVNKQHIWNLFGADAGLVAYFRENPGADRVFALLSMQRRDKLVYVTDEVNGMLVRDVPKTTVSFSDHGIFFAHPDEAQTRTAMRQCMFNSVVGFVRGYLAFLGAPNDPRELQDGPTSGFASFLSLSDRDLRDPATYLEVLVELLDNPAALMDIDENSISVNRMGILMRDDTDALVNRFDYQEFALGHVAPRVLSLVSYSRDEFENHRPSSAATLF